MRRIVFSLAMIALVGSLAIGATKAWFTDQATVHNSLAAGKLDVDLRGANAGGITISLDTTQYFKGGMAPGVEYGPYEIAVYNKGWGMSTLPVKYSWTANRTGGNEDMYNLLNVKVRDGNCDWINASWFVGQGYIYQGKLKDMGRVVPNVVLNPNITRCTWFYFQLDPTANNSLQGASSQFNLVLDATQPENSEWTQ